MASVLALTDAWGGIALPAIQQSEITQEQAGKAALRAVPGNLIETVALPGCGHRVYYVDVLDWTHKSHHVVVDALNGKILKVE